MKLSAAILLSASLLALPAKAEEVTIGISGPLSGAQAFFGSTWHNGIKLYVDKVNAAGGVNGVTISINQQDDKADPREGTLVAQLFCDDEDVKIAIVNFNSGVAQSTLPIYEDCTMPNMTFGSNPALTQQGYEYMVRPVANDLAGRSCPRSTRSRSSAPRPRSSSTTSRSSARAFPRSSARTSRKAAARSSTRSPWRRPTSISAPFWVRSSR